MFTVNTVCAGAPGGGNRIARVGIAVVRPAPAAVRDGCGDARDDVADRGFACPVVLLIAVPAGLLTNVVGFAVDGAPAVRRRRGRGPQSLGGSR